MWPTGPSKSSPYAPRRATRANSRTSLPSSFCARQSPSMKPTKLVHALVTVGLVSRLEQYLRNTLEVDTSAGMGCFFTLERWIGLLRTSPPWCPATFALERPTANYDPHADIARSSPLPEIEFDGRCLGGWWQGGLRLRFSGATDLPSNVRRPRIGRQLSAGAGGVGGGVSTNSLRGQILQGNSAD